MSTSHSPTKTSFIQHLASVFARKWTAEWIWGTVKKQAMEAPTRWEDPLKTEREKKFQRTVGWFSNTKYRTMTANILLSGFHVFLCRFPFLCGSGLHVSSEGTVLDDPSLQRRDGLTVLATSDHSNTSEDLISQGKC